MQLFKGRLGLLLIVALAFLATGANAALDWSIGVVTTPLGGGDWEYTYTVTNEGTSTEDIFGLSLTLAGGVTASVTNAPTDWFGSFIAPTADWVSLFPGVPPDIGPGSSLNHFTIESPFAPGIIQANVEGTSTSSPLINTTGPVATPIPEASTFALLGLGMALGLLKLRRKKA